MTKMMKAVRNTLRGMLPGNGLRADNVLADVSVNSYYHRAGMPTIGDTATAGELRKVLADQEVLFPLTVVDAQGHICGMLTMETIRPVYFADAEHDLFLVRDMMTPLTTCLPEDPMASVLRKFEASGYSRLPVVSRDNPDEMLGYIQFQDIMIAYETELARRGLD